MCLGEYATRQIGVEIGKEGQTGDESERKV
jgi:hypothetical protein